MIDLDHTAARISRTRYIFTTSGVLPSGRMAAQLVGRREDEDSSRSRGVVVVAAS
jgi:hypothetical protein